MSSPADFQKHEKSQKNMLENAMKSKLFFNTFFCDFFHLSCLWKSAGEDMFQENPCKTLAGRTKIDIRQGLANKIAFSKWKCQCYIFEAKKPSK